MNQEIRETLEKTWTWLREKHFAQYASLDDATQMTLMQSQEARALSSAIDTAACADDVVQTKAACRAYLRHWREVLKVQEKQ